MARKKLRPGVGANASILTRFIHPRLENPDRQHRSQVVLSGREDIVVNRKLQQCFLFSLDGVDGTFHAVAKHFKILNEGPRDSFFDPADPEESGPFKEPKIKWRKSRAKKLLYNDLLDGVVPMEQQDANGNETMSIEDIYMIHEEFLLYDFDKFKNRLKALRKKILELNDRSAEDEQAFENYKANHQPSLFSHKGYAQYQGSTTQELLLDDLDAFMNDPTMKPKDLWMSRKEYMREFPLDAFRDKIYQEIRTAKYIRTLKARSEGQDV